MTQMEALTQSNEQEFAGRSIFISYAHQDQKFAFRLFEDLKARGADVWIDQDEIHGGKIFNETIASAIEGHDEFLVVLTPAALESKWVPIELAQAFDLGKGLLPVLLEPLSKRRPIELVRVQDINFTGDYNDGFDELKHSEPYIRPQLPLIERFIRWIFPNRLARRVAAVVAIAILVFLAAYAVWSLMPSNTSATVLDTPKEKDFVSLQIANHGGRPATLKAGYRLKFLGLPDAAGDLKPYGSPPADVIPGHGTQTIQLFSEPGFGWNVTRDQMRKLLPRCDVTVEFKIEESNAPPGHLNTYQTPAVRAAYIGEFIINNLAKVTHRERHVE